MSEKVGGPGGQHGTEAASKGGREGSGSRAKRQGAASGSPGGRGDRSSGSPGPRRGRPVGSVSLTPEIAAKIITYLRAGAFAHVAAEAAGISERTFRDWVARGEGRHPFRGPTPKLRAFAREVRRAQAEARVAAEAIVYREHPKFWLSHVARSRPGSEGWSHPASDPYAGRRPLDEAVEVEDAREALARRLDEIAERRLVRDLPRPPGPRKTKGGAS